MKYVLISLASLLLIGCGNAVTVNTSDAGAPQSGSPTPQLQLSQIDLTKIGHLSAKGRVQDREYQRLDVVDQLLAHGKESIPFLISKLEDETKIEGHVIDYWYQVYVGDVAFIILSDLFLDSTWKKSTVPGMKWDELLGRGNNKKITGEQVLRNYVDRYGRKRIKEKWQNVWEKYQQRIFWDEQERAFKVREL